MRAHADRAGVALDDVPDGGEVYARANDGDDYVIRSDRGREEERGLVGDHRVRRVAHVRRALHRGEEVLAERDARAFIGWDGGRDDGSFGANHGDGFVLGAPGPGPRDRVPGDRPGLLIA